MKNSRVIASLLTVAALTASLVACVPEPTPSATPTPSVEPTPSETPTAEPPAGLSPSDYDNIAAAVNTGNTAALEGYLADPVVVIFAASECCGPQTPIEAISSLDYLTNATGPWTFPTPEPTVDTYRAGFYTDYFPADAFVGQSSDMDPFVISFTVVGDEITTIFVSAAASLLLP